MEERRDDNFIWPLQTLLRHSCPFLQHLRSYAESGRSHQDFSLGPWLLSPAGSLVMTENALLDWIYLPMPAIQV